MRVVITFFVAFLITGFCYSQEQEKEIIQFTGVVFNQDSTTVVPGVHIYIPKSGRGTTTNPYGFFSMPVMEGDSVVFSAVGFKRSFYIIPKHTGSSTSSLQLIVTLNDDIQFLEEVEIRPYPTEEMFKEALITMELPYEREYANIHQWMNSEIMRRGYYDLPNSPNANHRYFVQQQFQAYINRYSPPQNQLLNPFAWANFINSLKRKKK